VITANQADALIHAAKSKAAEMGIAVSVVFIGTPGRSLEVTAHFLGSSLAQGRFPI